MINFEQVQIHPTYIQEFWASHTKQWSLDSKRVWVKIKAEYQAKV